MFIWYCQHNFGMVRETQKVYPDRKVQPVNGKYGQVAIPPDVLDDDRFDIEREKQVSVKGIIESDGETYLKIGGV